MLEKLRETFLQNIRSEAKRQGLTYADVAERAGLSRSGIYKIMQGDREPGFDNIERIARALNVQPAALLLDPADMEQPEISASSALEIVAKALHSTPQLSGKPHIPGLSEKDSERLLRVLSESSVGASLILAAVAGVETTLNKSKRGGRSGTS